MLTRMLTKPDSKTQRFLGSTLICCFVMALVTISYVVASSAVVHETTPTKSERDRDRIRGRILDSEAVVTGFYVSQNTRERSQGGPATKVDIKMQTVNSDVLTETKQGRIIVTRLDGSEVVHGQVEFGGCLIADDFVNRRSTKRCDFTMLTKPSAVELADDEIVRGTLFLTIDGHEFEFALPETRAHVSR